MAKVVSLSDSIWTDGFMYSISKRCYDKTIPAMVKLMTDTERQKFLGNFYVASGEEEGEHHGPVWNDGDFYKLLESMCRALALTKDAKLGEQLDSYIEVIGKTQRSDGYIGTKLQIANRYGAKKQAFENPMDFEMYNIGHLITAACVHYRATAKNSLLNIAIKTANFLDTTFAEPTPQQARNGICPSHLMALLDLFRLTNNKKYVELSRRLLNMRDLVTIGDDDNQDRIPFRQQKTAVGHAVRSTYLYAGVADIFSETGEAVLFERLQAIWTDMVTRKIYITGGCGALFDGASPDGSPQQTSIARVHQAFGRNYQLPNSTSHNEGCAAVGNILFSWRMFLLTAELKYVDMIEQTLFNSVLTVISYDGSAYFYTNTMRQLNPMPIEDLRWPRQRQSTISVFCCPPNSLRTLIQSSNYAYAISRYPVNNKPAVYVLLYGSSTLNTKLEDNTVIKLKQQTDYPWSGSVSITIECDEEFTIIVRIPNWTQKASVSSKAKQEVENVKSGVFHSISAKWSSNDVINIEFEMNPRLVESHPYVEENRNQVAIMRGPVVYCIESTDLPSNAKVLDVFIPQNITLTASKNDNFFGGNVWIIEGKALLMSNSDNQWNNILYKNLLAKEFKEFDAKFIPYFAWDNRGQSEMTVWMPLRA